jgi:hypothetical protein
MLVAQIGRDSPAAQAVTTSLLHKWEAELAAGVRRTQGSGETAPSHDPERMAAAIVATIQGGVVVLLATGGIDHLEAGLDLVLAHLFDA